MTPRSRFAVRQLIAIVLCLSALACGSGWTAIHQPEPESYPARQQAQVWLAGRATQLHGLRLTSDSVSGIPFLQPLSCDTCRLTFSRTQVDSVRLGDPTGGFWGSTGLVLVGLLVAAFAICTTGSVDCTGGT